MEQEGIPIFPGVPIQLMFPFLDGNGLLKLFLVGPDNRLHRPDGLAKGCTYPDFPIAQNADRYVLASSETGQGIGYPAHFTDCFHFDTVTPMQKIPPMLLHLLQDIPYTSFSSLPRDGEEAIAMMLTHLDSAPTGSEACLRLSSVLTTLEGGYQDPPGEEMRLAVEKGEIHPHIKGDFSIASGSYKFLQLPIAPQAEAIAKRLEEILSDGPPIIYLRILKESAVELVVQLLFKA